MNRFWTQFNKYRFKIKTVFIGVFFVAILLSVLLAESKQIRVGIIDTGINSYLLNKLPICGYKDFTGRGINDVNGHGSHIAATIAKYAKGSDYCFIIMKFYEKGRTERQNIISSRKALQYATTQQLDILNYSGGGASDDHLEKLAIDILIGQNVKINAAAGNNRENLNIYCNFYPACYNPNKINVIGAYENGLIPNTFMYASYSNKGSFLKWEYGTESVEVGFNKFVEMRGTSQATAVYSGKMIYEKDQTNRRNSTRNRTTARRIN